MPTDEMTMKKLTSNYNSNQKTKPDDVLKFASRLRLKHLNVFYVFIVDIQMKTLRYHSLKKHAK